MKILIICGSTVGKEMTGTAIRCWEIANALAKSFDVTLTAKEVNDLPNVSFQVTQYCTIKLLKMIFNHDVVVSQGFNMFQLLVAKFAGTRIIYDLYAPVHFEYLERFRSLTKMKRFGINKELLITIKLIFSVADHILCASEKQRDLWLGMMSTQGLISPSVYDEEPNLRNRIAVVPFGIPAAKPMKRNLVLKGIFPGIQENDKVLVWGGGIWNWFDPITLIKAMANISIKYTNIKLFFLGVKSPDPNIPIMSKARDAMVLAEELEIKDRFVFFNENWVPYNQRTDYLLDSDAGVSLHLDHLETRFSFRTRILDYLWAELPIICSQGDFFAELVEKHTLGIVIPCGDEAGVEQAIEKILFDQEFRQQCKNNIAQFKSSLTWERCLFPLFKMCILGKSKKSFRILAQLLLLSPLFTVKKIFYKVLKHLG